MKNRIAELDYLKSIFILLMIVFHLVYIGDKYPYAKSLVYTFHMPAFLIISGYVMNIAKGIRPFLRTMWWIFIPYAVMETGYVIMSAILPVRESVEHLSVSLWLDKLFLHPLGPYWYLHADAVWACLFIGGQIGWKVEQYCYHLDYTGFMLCRIVSLWNTFFDKCALLYSRSGFKTVFT